MGFVFVERMVARAERCRRATLTAARLHAESGDNLHSFFVTLTYRPGVEWQAGHISQLVKCVRSWARRRGVSARGVWVHELTLRGVPHYHLLVTLPKWLSLPKPDKRGWWAYGMTQRQVARRAVGYLAKYASKGVDTQQCLPRGARICGAFGLTASERAEKAWWMLPRWVRDYFAPGDRPTKVRGGYLSRVTGEILVSPWRIVEVGPKWAWLVFTNAPPHAPPPLRGGLDLSGW